MKARLLLSLLLGLLALTACDGNSPTGPDGQPLVFQGAVVANDSTGSWDPLDLRDDTIVRINVTSLTATPAITGTPSLGFGLGEPTGETCTTTFRTVVRSADTFAFGLSPGGYCLLFYDAGTIPDNTTVAYTFTVELE